MKKIVSMLLILSMLCSFVVVSSGCKKESKELNLFNWTEYLPQEVIDQFEAETGIKINYNMYSSNEEMLAKVIAAPGTYDLVVSSDYMVDIMGKQQLLEPIDKSKITLLSNIGEEYLNKAFDPGNQYTVPYMCGTALIAVNTKLVEIEIAHYEDLWDPSLKDNIVSLDDQRGLMGVALKKLGFSINDTDPAHLELVSQEMSTLKENIKAFDSDSPKTLLINEEVAVGFVWNAEAVLAQKENPDIKIVMPEEGLYLWQDNLLIPKGAKHKEYAQEFMNFILRPEISKMLSEAFPYTNPNRAAKELLADDIKNNLGIYPPASVYEQGEYLVDLGETTVLYDKIWTEFKQE